MGGAPCPDGGAACAPLPGGNSRERIGPAEALELAQRIAFDHGSLRDGDLQSVVRWLQPGLRRYLQGEAPLEVALRLTGAARIAARNRALIEAARVLDGGRGLSAWDLAKTLSASIRRFESVHLPRLRAGLEIEPTPLNLALARAFDSGARPLGSRRRLYDLLATDRHTDELSVDARQHEAVST